MASPFPAILSVPILIATSRPQHLMQLYRYRMVRAFSPSLPSLQAETLVSHYFSHLASLSLKFDPATLQRDLHLLPRYYLRSPPTCSPVPFGMQDKVLKAIPRCHMILLQLRDLPTQFLSWSILRTGSRLAATCFGETIWPHSLQRPVAIFAIFSLPSPPFHQAIEKLFDHALSGWPGFMLTSFWATT